MPNNSNHRLRVLQDGKIVYADNSMLCGSNGLAAVIKIPEEEYHGIREDARFLSHFNRSPVDFIEGQDYAIARIIEHGRDSASENQQPLLSFTDIAIGRCKKARNDLSFSDLSEKDFECSLAHIKDTNSLKRYMVKRYTASYPYTPTYVLSMPISMTMLEIVARHITLRV